VAVELWRPHGVKRMTKHETLGLLAYPRPRRPEAEGLATRKVISRMGKPDRNACAICQLRAFRAENAARLASRAGDERWDPALDSAAGEETICQADPTIFEARQ